ncbi:hypothetical protein AQPE_3484 [Aquipluma nitroreducens]|uniref:Uncharacterized protein n=1 Tax=Aquipluma nitroreducens TaxID=2010828 RepID=A0A5K7S5C6_9BACT|nr:hypothetical protein AQPE_0902 [Aquipluma nitroreducens]BBE17920.1 hypothetical protein AQPE_2079 [Aquipluma nitroreducens]BBE17929.1 hypothetical protein AQPE_2088 [Aquipluma nitroreducens]BBE18032.1 hypothetical protein AQPE_2192 [Aquipluma nitroreducens]BBE19229.1 hypothetical protein AQPE_3405 [Aquipluma nitroreducens]
MSDMSDVPEPISETKRTCFGHAALVDYRLEKYHTFCT